jgi:DNA-binding Xre family transcriptional regulator
MEFIDNKAVDGYNVNRIIICLREVSGMKISYKKLWIMLVEKDISPATLRKDLNIAPGTMTKLRRNEEVALSILLRICEYLDCNIGDISDAVRIEVE